MRKKKDDKRMEKMDVLLEKENGFNGKAADNPDEENLDLVIKPMTGLLVYFHLHYLSTEKMNISTPQINGINVSYPTQLRSWMRKYYIVIRNGPQFGSRNSLFARTFHWEEKY